MFPFSFVHRPRRNHTQQIFPQGKCDAQQPILVGSAECMPAHLRLRVSLIFKNKDFFLGKNRFRFFAGDPVLVHILQGILGIPLETDDLRPINHPIIVYFINIHSRVFFLVQNLPQSRGAEEQEGGADSRRVGVPPTLFLPANGGRCPRMKSAEYSPAEAQSRRELPAWKA